MITYFRQDGEKPVLNEKTDDRFIEIPLERITSIKTRKPPEKAPPREEEKPEKKPLDKNLREGIRLFRMRRWENALKGFLLIKPDNFSDEEKAELAYYTGLCYTKLKRYEDAPLYLEKVVSSGKDVMRSYQCRMTLAYIYIVTGKVKMAEFELKRLRNNGFESAPLYNTLAYAAYAQRQYKNAIEYYEKALDMDQDNATAMNSMGYILADTGIDRIRGLRMCRKAVEYNPRSPAYLDSLGWAHYKCGNFDEARNWLSRAAEIAPKEKEIKEHYSIVIRGKP